MTAANAWKPHLSVADYLEGERSAELRHEYVGGEVYAMTGSSARHNLIAGNLYTRLRPEARQRGCQLFVSDVKLHLRVMNEELFYYPDLMLVCDPEDREDDYYRTRPCLVVEILSPTTERIDRREKRMAYTTIDSLQEFLLISQERQRVEIYRRRNGWEAEAVETGAVRLECLDLEVALAALYEGVETAN